MSDKVLIGRAKAKNDKEQVIELKIYLGNIVELPDGSQTSLREDTYKKVLQQWESEHITIVPPEPKSEITDTFTENVEIEEKMPAELTEKTVVDEIVEETPINNEESAVISDNTDQSKENLKYSDIEKEKIPEIPDTKEKKDKKYVFINLLMIILLIAGTVAALSFIYGPFYLENNNPVTSGPDPTPVSTDYISVLQSKCDISQGESITEDMISVHKITLEEYNQVNDALYVSADGTTSNSNLISADNIGAVLDKFATRNISEGTYITHQDISAQKIIAEKTFVEVEIDGQTVSVPLEETFLAGDTRVKIVALITSENNEDTIAVALSEFILEDRALKDIFDSAGQSILEKISSQE